jgi:hypothetical protein
MNLELQKGYYTCKCRITHIDNSNKIVYVEFLDSAGNAVLLKDIKMDVAVKVLRSTEDELKEREKDRLDYANWYR